MVKSKIILLLSLFFILINSAVFFLTKLNEEQRVKLVLDDNMQTLTTHYEILLHTQKTIAQTMYLSTIASKKFIQIMSQAKDANEEQRKVLRAKLHKQLQLKYQRAKLKGVLQYHFVFPDNTVFLRMHKANKFGDDLTDVRADFKYVNETQKPIRAFTQGRTTHGFRNTFPIFDENNKHIGAMEISFASDNFQWFLNSISHIHTHFLVDKHIFDSKAWKRDDLALQYSQSSENSNYMLYLGKIHTQDKCIKENLKKLKPIHKEIESKMLRGKKFAEYVKHHSHVDVMAFLPIKNIENKTVAWIVSYEKSAFIETTLMGGFIIRVVMFFISLVLIYFISAQLQAKEEAQTQHKLLDDILNATEDIIFITDFKKVSFSNDKFKHLFNIKHTQEFNKNIKSVLNIFRVLDGYMNASLLKDNETPISLFMRTPEDERIVSILDRHLNPKSFKISISLTNTKEKFLITLSDITVMQEKQEITHKKAYLDGLTQVPNRNSFDELFVEELYRVKTEHKKLSMAIIDIDNFKIFNDTHGHLVGDEVLIMMAQDINKHVRKTDIFARWGGEEFVILFIDANIEIAKIISEKLKDNIQKLEHKTAGNITVSFGITQFKEGDTTDSIFQRCDEALYLAKENGRNRVEVL